MLKIRLSRGGSKNDPSYRIVVTEKTRKREGKANDIIGHWYPKKDELKIDKDKLSLWISRGAQTTSVVERLIKQKK